MCKNLFFFVSFLPRPYRSAELTTKSPPCEGGNRKGSIPYRSFFPLLAKGIEGWFFWLRLCYVTNSCFILFDMTTDAVAKWRIFCYMAIANYIFSFQYNFKRKWGLICSLVWAITKWFVFCISTRTPMIRTWFQLNSHRHLFFHVYFFRVNHRLRLIVSVSDDFNRHTHFHIARYIGNCACMVRTVTVSPRDGPFDAGTSRVNPWVEVDITPGRFCCGAQTHAMNYLLKVIFYNIVFSRAT